MSLKRYGVLVGRPIASKLGAGQSPHYQIHVVDDTTQYRIAVNVKSKLSPSELLYLVIGDYRHEVTERLAILGPGYHLLASTPESRRRPRHSASGRIRSSWRRPRRPRGCRASRQRAAADWRR